MRLFLFAISLLMLISLESCTTSYDKNLGVTIDVMYAEGLHEFSSNNFTAAKKIFEAISDQYPFSKEAIEANIFLIWIYYLEDDITSLEVTVDSYLRYYVYNEYTPWVTYMSAVARYEQMYPSDKDQTYTRDALISFTDIVRKDTIDKKYIKDATYKLQVIKYKLAEKDNQVAYYYLKRKNYLAALKRYQDIAVYYSDTEFVKEALYRQVYILLVLGIKDEAYKVTATLGYNYPSSDWYTKSLSLLKLYGDGVEKKADIAVNRGN